MAPPTVSERSHIAIFFRPGQIRRFWPQKKNSGRSLLSKQKFSHGGTTMLAITVLVAAAGDGSFNVFVLALLLIVAIIGVSAIGVWGGSSLLVVALRVSATLACLQIGYLIGSLIAAQLPARVINRTQTQYVRRLAVRT